jgi:ribulose-phosphate 3-epimerase
MFDGTDERAPGSMTIGPQAIASITKSLSLTGARGASVKTDVHVMAQTPGWFIKPLALAGVSRFTVQFETLKKAAYADGGSDVAVYGVLRAFAQAVQSYGMTCGVCVAPETDILEFISTLGDLLETGGEGGNEDPLIEYVNVLCVNAGVGGQAFDEQALDRISYVRRRCPQLKFLGVDGGIHAQSNSNHDHHANDASVNTADTVDVSGTARGDKNKENNEKNEKNENDVKSTLQQAYEAGANFFVSGTGIFGKDRSFINNDSDEVGGSSVAGRVEVMRQVLFQAAAKGGEE